MLDSELRAQISDSLVEVFGTMYFMPVQMLEGVPDRNEWDLDSVYVSAEINFVRKKNTRIKFFFPDNLARNVAEGFLGIDPDEISDSQAVDTMKEAANMVVGCFLGKADPDGICKLGIPIASRITDFSPDVLGQGSDLIVFRSEYGFLWLDYSDED